MDERVDLGLFVAVEGAAIALLESGKNYPKELLTRLGACLDYILWSLFARRPETASFWSDGIDLESPEPIQTPLCVTGLLWCADHRQQWRVPFKTELHICQGPRLKLTHVEISLGDGAFNSLKVPDVRKFREPETWLCTFPIPRPDEEIPHPETFLNQLHRWLSSMPGSVIVGPDWQPLPLERAERLIRERVLAGESVTLTPTWLDGADAIHVR